MAPPVAALPPPPSATCPRSQPPLLVLPHCSGSSDIDMDDAKRVGGEALEAVLRTQLGVFAAGALAAGCCAAVTLATKALFLGQLSASEASQLAEVGADGGSGGASNGAGGLAAAALLQLWSGMRHAPTAAPTWLLPPLLPCMQRLLKFVIAKVVFFCCVGTSAYGSPMQASQRAGAAMLHGSSCCQPPRTIASLSTKLPATLHP